MPHFRTGPEFVLTAADCTVLAPLGARRLAELRRARKLDTEEGFILEEMRRFLTAVAAGAGNLPEIGPSAPEIGSPSALVPGTFLDCSEAARRLGLTDSSGRRIRQLIENGRLEGVKVDGRWMVVAASLEAEVARREGRSA